MSEQSGGVVSFDDYRFQKAMQVLHAAGYQDVAAECYFHRSFSIATQNRLDEVKRRKDKTDD